MKIEIDDRAILGVKKIEIYTGTAAHVKTLTYIPLYLELPEATIRSTHTAYLVILRNKEDMANTGDLTKS